MELHTDLGAARAVLETHALPWSRFERHRHPGGEEILVLDGVFQDEHGDNTAGSWLRNPPWSIHRPWTDPGSTILVKTGHLPDTPGA